MQKLLFIPSSDHELVDSLYITWSNWALMCCQSRSVVQSYVFFFILTKLMTYFCNSRWNVYIRVTLFIQGETATILGSLHFYTAFRRRVYVNVRICLACFIHVISNCKFHLTTPQQMLSISLRCPIMCFFLGGGRA